MSLMGLDIGTTGCKAVVFDPEGRELARAYREYPEVYPQPGFMELEAERVWQSIQAVIAEAAAGAADPVQALSISAMGESFAPVDAQGNFLYNSIISPDGRAAAEATGLAEQLGAERIFQHTGMTIHPSFTLPKIMWMAAHLPEIHARTWKYLLWPDIVALKLGLTPRLDYSLAGRTMAFDVAERRWSSDLLQAAGVSEEVLAEPIASGEVIGELSATAAAQVGLPAGCLVVAGGHDQPMNALGAGVIEPGLAVDGMGTVECVTTPFAQPVLTEAMRQHNYCCYSHVVPGMYCTIAFNYSSGSILRWYRDNFCALRRQEAEASGRDVYELILAGLPAAPTGLFTVPYFAGSGTPYLDPQAKGAILGLTLGCDEPTLVKGLLEGICYELNLNLTSLATAGVEIRRLRVTGGGSKSPAWLQIKADITGCEVVTLNVTEGGCLAGAMLGGVACGVYASLAQAASVLVQEKDTYFPNADRRQTYQGLYTTYARLWPALRDIVHELG